MAIVDTEDIRCPACGHMPHPPNGCLNMGSANDCNFKAGYGLISAQEQQSQVCSYCSGQSDTCEEACPLAAPAQEQQPCVEGVPMMHGDKPYRWCVTHDDLMLRCECDWWQAQAKRDSLRVYELSNKLSGMSAAQAEPELRGRDTDWDKVEVEQVKRNLKSWAALPEIDRLRIASEEAAHWNRMYRELAWENAREAVSATPIPEVEAAPTVEKALAELRELFPKASWREVRFTEESTLKVTIAFNGYSPEYSSTFSGSSLAEALSAAREWKESQ